MSLDKIFDLYGKLELGKNSICKKCVSINGSSFSKPISIWKVGKNFPEDEYKILFVGKVARGNTTKNIIDGLFIDSTKLGDQLLTTCKWPYWSYTRKIIENLYGTIETGKENVAFSNLIKCNSSMTTDKSENLIKKYCIDELKVIWREIEILRPKKIIFYTNWDYDNFIEGFRPTDNFEDIKNNKHKIKIGAKNMPYWNRVFYDNNGAVLLEFLRIGHPERKKKSEFVNKITNWIEKPDANIGYNK